MDLWIYFLLGFVAVMFALDRINGSVTAKIIEAVCLAALVGAAIEIFATGDSLKFAEHIAGAFDLGAKLKGGGFIGALIGHPISWAFGNTGAGITIILLIFVLFMLITGTTLITLFKAICKPVKKISEHAESNYQERIEREESSGKKLKVIKGFQADIPVDEPENNEPELNEQQKRLVNAYHGNTQGSMSILGNEERKRAFRPLLPDVDFITFNSKIIYIFLFF